MSALASPHAAMETLFDPDGGAALGGAHTSVDRGSAVTAERDADRTRIDASPAGAAGSQTLRATSGGGPMLDDLLAGVWEGLAAHRVVACPVCASEMRPEYGAHALPIGGRCGACGSTLV
jgi:hypothetical protein